MPEYGLHPQESDDPQLDPDDPGEVPTRFVTKGLGWSGREKAADDEGDDNEDSSGPSS